MAREGEMTRVFATSRAVHLALLSLPFVAVVAATSGLRHVFSVYQAYDELHHHAIVLQVARVWPRAVLDGYESWSGPLVYWLLAGLTRPFGASLEAGRLVVALFSWATCAVAYVVFRDRLGASPRVALALASVLALSPFFFGESFYVLTDNPTWFFVVLALERLLAYVREPAAGRVAAYALFAAAATLMRQISVWLLVPGVVAAASVRCPPRLRAVAAASVVLAAVPPALLLVHWGGPLPGGGYQTDPAAFRVRNVCLGLAVVGLYALLLVPVEELRSLPRRLGRRGGLACGVVAALAVAAVAVGAMGGVAQRDIYGIGLLGKLLEGWPVVAGAGVVWWVLVPLGAVAVAVLVVTRTHALVDRVLVVALAAVVLSSAANTTWFQRYVDFPVLLVLLALVASGRAPVRRIDVLRWAGIVALSVVWAAVFGRN